MPAPIITPSLLQSLKTYPHLPANTWYFITGVTLSMLNRPEEIPKLFRHTIGEEEGSPTPSSSTATPTAAPKQQHQDHLIGIARRLREALVKSASVGGLPKTINALLALKSATPAHLLDAPLEYSPTARSIEVHDVPPSQVLQRGQAFFDNVYGKVSKRVMGQMDRCGTEDLGTVARLMYGYILSNTSVLTAAESSFVLIAGLIPQDVNPQLKGHLKGALNNGATLEEVRAVRDVVINLCERSGMEPLDDRTSNGWGWRKKVSSL